MNIRKLKRKTKKGKKKSATAPFSKDNIMKNKAHNIVESAVGGDAKVDYIGNFIFFSTTSGDAWLLDHRESRALRLADRHKAVAYNILETKERFAVEWKERFTIQNDLFITTRKEEETVYSDYPTKAIEGIIEMLKRKLDYKRKTSIL